MITSAGPALQPLSRQSFVKQAQLPQVSWASKFLRVPLHGIAQLTTGGKTRKKYSDSVDWLLPRNNQTYTNVHSGTPTYFSL